jgi:hypothetical protein
MGSIAAKLTAEIESLSRELSSLARRQYEALQKSPYTRMSQSEAAAYDSRRERIGKIREYLSKHKPHRS